MLVELRIGQIALVDEVILDFASGLTVLTGETGAGKSMIGTALSLLSGGRAPRDLIRSGAEEGYVEGVFDFSADTARLDMLSGFGVRVAADGVLVLRREIRRQGKSRVMINGLVSSLGLLERIGPRLLSIQSQDQQRELARSGFAGDYLDERLGLLGLRQQLSDLLDEYNALLEKIETRRREEAAAVEQLDMWRYQFQELEQAGLREDEEDELNEALNLLRHAGVLQTGAAGALDILSEGRAPVAEALGEVLRLLGPLVQKSSKLAAVDELLRSAADSVSEASLGLNRFLDTLDLDSEKLEELEERRALYDQLKRKYGTDVSELIAMHLRLGSWIERQENASSDIAELCTERDDKRKDLQQLAAVLHEKREEGSKGVAESIRERVRSLGLSETELEFGLEPRSAEDGIVKVNGLMCRLTSRGTDRVTLLVSTNRGEDLAAVADVASGGEKSRIYLGLMANKADVDGGPLILFDEIDAGLGMESAATMATMLQQMAEKGQVLVITHWPTMAVRGRSHYGVKKIERDGRKVLVVENLQGEKRTDEIARLLGGVEAAGDEGGAQRTYARELLAGRRV